MLPNVLVNLPRHGILPSIGEGPRLVRRQEFRSEPAFALVLAPRQGCKYPLPVAGDESKPAASSALACSNDSNDAAHATSQPPDEWPHDSKPLVPPPCLATYRSVSSRHCEPRRL